MFVPNLDSFPEQFKPTTLGVNDLVEHCISKGYVKTVQQRRLEHERSSCSHNGRAAVQPSATVTTYTVTPPTVAFRTGSQRLRAFRMSCGLAVWAKVGPSIDCGDFINMELDSSRSKS